MENSVRGARIRMRMRIAVFSIVVVIALFVCSKSDALVTVNPRALKWAVWEKNVSEKITIFRDVYRMVGMLGDSSEIYAAFLDSDVYEQLCSLNDRVQKAIRVEEEYLKELCNVCTNLDKKEFADVVNVIVNPEFRGMVFAYRNGKNWKKICNKMILDGVIDI